MLITEDLLIEGRAAPLKMDPLNVRGRKTEPDDGYLSLGSVSAATPSMHVFTGLVRALRDIR